MTDGGSEPLILLVDDDPLLLRALSRSCRCCGLKTQTASNGQEALQLLDRGSFDLIVCDVRMPVMDGRDLLCELARRGPLSGPFIFLTGHCDYPDAELLDLGAEAVVKKPMRAAEFRNLLRKYAAPHAGPRSLISPAPEKGEAATKRST